MEYLRDRGIRILECNYRNRSGEIDLIGLDEEYLIFFEVKYRRNDSSGHPEEAVGLYKQRQICKVADYYRIHHGIGSNVGIRYDVIAIENNEIRWIQNAFSHIYR